ncbi:MAG: hypothetical protein CVV21_12195 [Candidatus Goldiibacteriota bacterium HGW-Goldbacteria-1]|nr:MAG: hypothetical protein CVV21_12195 [Candidatus Goldiibacteriota bacterium HGW-Goldbacteria-1]
MRKIILTVCIIGVISAGLLYAQGKNGVTETAQPSADTTTVPVVTTAATVSVDTKESKTIKTEIQSPGVVTEYKEDGIKVVTINLSEVDENKLPEKYEAKVILEAPIYVMPETIEEQKKFKSEEVYFLQLNEYPQAFDVKIDAKGNIYVLDTYAEKIHKFNDKGVRVKQIPIKDTIKTHFVKEGDGIGFDKFKNEIAINSGLYIRDTASSIIESIDENGKVLETIDVPKEINGKSTRKMKMWADEEGVRIGESKSIRGEWKSDKKIKSNKTEEVVIKQIDVKGFKIEKGVIKMIIVQNSPSAISSKFIGTDANNNIFIWFYAGLGKETAIVKIDAEGKLLFANPYWKYMFGKEWFDECGNAPQPLLLNWEQSLLLDENGNLYIFQLICCTKKQDCDQKIRVIRLNGV